MCIYVAQITVQIQTDPTTNKENIKVLDHMSKSYVLTPISYVLHSTSLSKY